MTTAACGGGPYACGNDPLQWPMDRRRTAAPAGPGDGPGVRSTRIMSARYYRFEGFELDAAARELRGADGPVALPLKSFDCLVYLLERRERAVGRDELISAVWGRVDVSDALLGQTLARARRAVGDTGEDQRVIRTVARFGYHWVAPVEIVVDDALPGATHAAPVERIAQPLERAASAPVAARAANAPDAGVLRHRVAFAGAALVLAAIVAAAVIAS